MCNENLCSVAFVLDRSGSMESMRHQAIAGYNDFLEVAQSVPVAQMIHLDAGTYIPGGNTALDDAVGITIDCSHFNRWPRKFEYSLYHSPCSEHDSQTNRTVQLGIHLPRS